jgi:hypothetical protein
VAGSALQVHATRTRRAFASGAAASAARQALAAPGPAVLVVGVEHDVGLVEEPVRGELVGDGAHLGQGRGRGVSERAVHPQHDDAVAHARRRTVVAGSSRV